MSAVSSALVQRLGLTSNEWVPVTGIHGPEEALIYQVTMVLPISEVGGGPTYVSGRQLEVAELSLPGLSNFEVILGMDFLHPFHLTLFRDNFILSN